MLDEVDIKDQKWLLKENWGDGEWQQEPDEDIFLYRNYKCIINRNPFGSLNGYVQVPKGSKFREPENFEKLNVHGGITFSGSLDEDEPDDFWIGFDTGHWDDIQPVHLAIEDFKTLELKKLEAELKSRIGDPLRKRATYKNLEYVSRECEGLVNQMSPNRETRRKVRH